MGARSHCEDHPHCPRLWRKDTGNVPLEDGKLVSPEETAHSLLLSGEDGVTPLRPPSAHLLRTALRSRLLCVYTSTSPSPLWRRVYCHSVPHACWTGTQPSNSGHAPPPSGSFPSHQPQDALRPTDRASREVCFRTGICLVVCDSVNRSLRDTFPSRCF